MSSQAQLAANRANAAKGRGPRTAAGKTRASRNALRHGLAAISRHNLAYFHEIGRIAMAYCEGDTDPLLFEQALIIGESDVILSCLVGERLAAIERMRDPDAIPFSDSKASLARARARFAQAKRAYAQLVKAKQAKAAEHFGHGQSLDFSTEKPRKQTARQRTIQQRATRQRPVQPDLFRSRIRRRQCDECDAMCRAAPDLRRLERYERRAASRRNRAIREFIFIKSLREFRLRSEALQTQ